MRVSELRSGMRRVSVTARVVEISAPRDVVTRYGEARVATAIVADDTGQIEMSLWDDQIERVSVGDEVEVENGYVTEFRGKPQLNVGRYGRLTVR
ncbi:MAG: OB-fold nucleic acid binding domain-containing protein [Candidatus Bathyarchaeia archaeon]